MNFQDLPIFIISIKHTKRYNNLINHYSNNENFNNIQIIEFKPIKSLDLKTIEKEGFYDLNTLICFKLYDYKNKELFYGTFGCSHSHLLIYKKMIEQDINECIILEDNVFLDINYKQELNTLFNKLRDNNIKYDIIHLHSHKKHDINRDKIIDNIYKGYDECGGTKMYYLNKKTAKILYINNFPIISAADGITAIPSRIKNYNLNVLYYCFNSLKIPYIKSIRCEYDNNITDLHKNYKLAIDIKNYNFLTIKLNDKEISFKLKNNDITNKFISKMNELLEYKIKPLKITYNLRSKNINKLIDMLTDEIKKFGINDVNESKKLLLLLENKKYDELNDIIYNNINCK